MKIDCRLEYSTIIANQGRPVHLAVQLVAGKSSTETRRPMAFCVVLDRSGSMAGKPLSSAKTACETVIRNLRAEDEFALVAFDSHAEVVVPMQKITDKPRAIAAVRAIRDLGSTNLTAGWMLGRDELNKTPRDTTRRILLLSDGHVNVGITEPNEISRIVADGLERSGIRTSSLGFAENYDETLLDSLATMSGGNFYDANLPDKLPAIFSAELDGLQKTAAQNVRIRIRKLTFCESWLALASYHQVNLPDGRTELALGDLVSEESAAVVFQLEVLPLPWLDDGHPAATLEGEALVELEILWDDLAGDEIKSCVQLQTLRILSTQNPEDVRVNVDVIPDVATQCTGLALEQALEAVREGNVARALSILKKAIQQLKDLNPDQPVEGIATLQSMVDRIEHSGELDARTTRKLRFTSSHMRKMKSSTLWTLDELAPGYSKNSIQPPPPADPLNPDDKDEEKI